MAKIKLVIGVISRSRPAGSTFQWVKKASVPVFVYVHEPEKTLYEELLPENFTVVAHDLDTIGKIKNFVHQHQAELGNKVMIMDDDITGIWNYDKSFLVSINDIIEKVNSTKADAIVFQWQINGIGPLAMLCGAYVVFPHMVHIKMNEGKYENEDCDGFLQYYLAEAKIERLPFVIKHEINSADSHFSNIWRCLVSANMYKKYGDICRLRKAPGNLFIEYDADLKIARDRKKNGIQYDFNSHKAIRDCIETLTDYYKDEDGAHKNFLIPELQKIYDSLPKIKPKRSGDNEQNI